METADVANTPSSAVPSFACPPPLRCRDISQALDDLAISWELPDSPVGTHGWTWGQGLPLYFLSGRGGSARLFCLLAWLLREQFRCTLVDWKLPARGPLPTLQEWVDDLSRLLREREDHPATVVGVSFGATLALETAARNPGQFLRLILHQVARRQRLSLAERVLATLFQESDRALQNIPGRETVQMLNHRRWFPPQDPDRWDWFQDVTGRIPLRLLISQSRVLHQTDLATSLSQVTCPVLLVNTEGLGPVSTAEQTLVASRLPAGVGTTLHSAGRHPYLTHPHRFMKLVQQFCSDPQAFAAVPDEPTFFPLITS